MRVGQSVRVFLGGPTGWTVLWVQLRPNNLQSLLDTTPPKRVPILWDGSAPAPSQDPSSATGNRIPRIQTPSDAATPFRCP